MASMRHRVGHMPEDSIGPRSIALQRGIECIQHHTSIRALNLGRIKRTLRRRIHMLLSACISIGLNFDLIPKSSRESRSSTKDRLGFSVDLRH